MLSIIIPTLNEAYAVVDTLKPLQAMRYRGVEVVVADGGSADATVERARPLADRVVVVRRGRAAQMNAGAAVAGGDVLWFLHADTLVSTHSGTLVEDAITAGAVWGRFDVRLSGRPWPLRVVERTMNLRSRWSGIATGDQGIFVRRQAFREVGGYPDIPLMEDIALSRALVRLGRPACISEPIVTSSRRWEEFGVGHTILLMWRLRLAFWLGADPHELHRRYHGVQPIRRRR